MRERYVRVQSARQREAVYVAFIGSGFAFASWASRIPQIRDALEATPSELGLILLAVAAGSLVADAAGRHGGQPLRPGPDVAVLASMLSLGLVVLALGTQVGVLPVVIGLFLIGYGNGTWDVAMNVEGAAVEQRLGRTIMPRFHAGFSVGTVAGALGGAACVALDISVTAHLLVVAAVNAARSSRSVPCAASCRVAAPRRCRRRPGRAGAAPADRVEGAAHAADRRCSCCAWRSPRASATTGSRWR